MDDFGFSSLPAEILLKIFDYLPLTSLGAVARVCRHWRECAYDNSIWKLLLRHHFSVTVTELERCLRDEFKRLYYHVPTVLAHSETNAHGHEVLHVCFSHVGDMFVTCSKDGVFKVWRSKCLTLSTTTDMNHLAGWDWTVCSQFNRSDTYLLVSGEVLGKRGEVAIFSVTENLRMELLIETVKAFRTACAIWLYDDIILMPSLTTSTVGSTSIVMMKPFEDPGSVSLYSYQNKNCCNIQQILVTECHTLAGDVDPEFLLIYKFGTVKDVPHNIGIKKLKMSSHDLANNITSACSDEHDFTRDVGGYIIGQCLSFDKKTLYISCRPWMEQTSSESSSSVKQLLKLSAINLDTFEIMDLDMSLDMPHCSTEQCNFLGLDVSQEFIASGNEDNEVCLWDLYTKKCFLLTGHEEMVNCATFSYQNQEMLVTVSDDRTFKVWKSRHQIKTDSREVP